MYMYVYVYMNIYLSLYIYIYIYIATYIYIYIGVDVNGVWKETCYILFASGSSRRVLEGIFVMRVAS